MSTLMRKGLIAALLLVLGGSAFVGIRGEAAAANAFPRIQASLALIGSVGANGHLTSLGTAFCVSSDGTLSYLLTNNHVVTDDNGVPESNLIVILARDMNLAHAPRYAATIVRRSEDPDLAIVSIAVPGLPRVRVATDRLPAVGDDIAIAGFPFNESILWGRLFGGRGLNLDRRFPPELTPSEHKGAVSAIHGGSYYIQYDAITDNGNSGGPLFDPSTGDVYGVVQASMEGAPERRDLPSPIRNNLAISIQEGWQFIARAPVSMDAQMTANAAEHFAGSDDECALAQARFEHAYGNWAHARSGLASTGLRAYARAEKIARRDMGRALRAVKRRDARAAGVDGALLEATTARNGSPSAIARAARRLDTIRTMRHCA